MAVEIPLKNKYRRGGTGKKNASRSSNSGTNKHRGETDKTRLAAAQAATRSNQMVLNLTPSGRLRWVRADQV